MLSSLSIRALVAIREPPLRVWVGTHAWAAYGPALAGLGASAEVKRLDRAQGNWSGPAILLLAAEDLDGPERSLLLERQHQAAPGRPVVLGGATRKHTLLDAINTWRAVRLLPARAPARAVIEAVRQAHAVLGLQVANETCARSLYEECQRVNAKLEELRATQQRLLHAERLATVGRIVGALRNQTESLYRILERLKAAQARVRNQDPSAEHLDCAVEAINSFGTLLDDLLALTENRSSEAQVHNEHLDELVRRATRLFRYDPMGRARTITTRCESQAVVGVDRYRLDHVLFNLLRNAVQATREEEPIEVRTRRDAGCAVIEVEDRGEGMSPETQQQIFTPFFTTKGRAGLGLGLRLAKTTVESQGGTLECASTPGQGTCFRIRLPLAG